MLARADFFVGSYHSKWARLVEWLRYGLYQKDRSSSVDASADHADLFTIIYSLFHSKVCPVIESLHMLVMLGAHAPPGDTQQAAGSS